MEITGKALVVGKTIEVGTSGFTKRELVIEVAGQYPQPILVEFHKDNTSKLDSIKVGQVVTVQTDLRGRKWTNAEGVDKYFNSIVGWRIEAANVSPDVVGSAVTEPDNAMPWE